MMTPPLMFAQPRMLPNGVGLGESTTTYMGRREREAVLIIAGRSIWLGIGDTARCAADLDATKRTLANLAPQAGMSAQALEGCATDLQAHCRQLTKWRERKPRY